MLQTAAQAWHLPGQRPDPSFVKEPSRTSGPRYQGFGLGTEPLRSICSCICSGVSLRERKELSKRFFSSVPRAATLTMLGSMGRVLAAVKSALSAKEKRGTPHGIPLSDAVSPPQD